MATTNIKLEFNPTSNAVTLLDPLDCSIAIIRRELLAHADVDVDAVRVVTVNGVTASYDLGSEETAEAVWADIATRDAAAVLWVREERDRWVRR